MILLIDVGNTRIKWAVCNAADAAICDSGIVADGDWSAVDHYVGDVDSAWMSCVASEVVSNSIVVKVKMLFGVTLQVAAVSLSAAGMGNDYRDLEKLGVDRWVAALGARSLARDGALIVIDAGTAITIDLVSEGNCFEGGVILPGFTVMHDSLLGKTAGIDSHRYLVESVIGKNTRDCVNAGVQYGLIGAIEKIVAEMCATLAGDVPRLMVMGGDAHVIAANSKLDVELQLNMIFYGLLILAGK